MLDKKKEEVASKRRAFEEVAREPRRMWGDSFYDDHPLAAARRQENGFRESFARCMAELLELTSEEMAFKQADEQELKESIRLTQKEREEISKKRTKKWLYMYARIHIKQEFNKMKENCKLALPAQEELYNELIAEAKGEEEKEWFKSLTLEQQIAARVALRKQRESCIKLQNEMLQVWEGHLIYLHSWVKDFPPLDWIKDSPLVD